jgi:predicted GNAT family acetyltransferase
VSPDLVHEADASRYALYIDGQLAAVADYAVRGDTVSFHHTFTDPARRGQGLAGRVVEFAMDDVAATSSRAVSPDCWYVAKWFAAHPERSDLLTVRR